MISSEMPELLGMCDRIYVMNEGRFVGELHAAEASQERIMALIVDGRDRHERHDRDDRGNDGRPAAADRLGTTCKRNMREYGHAARAGRDHGRSSRS